MSIVGLAGRVLPLLSKYIPVPTAIKGLTKISPKIGQFIVDATAYGYGADKILDYLRNEIDGGAFKEEKERVQSGDPSLRPDEAAAGEQIRQREAPSKMIQKGIGLATGIVGGLGALGEQDEGIDNEQPQASSRSVPQVASIQEEQMEPQQSKQIPVGVLEAISPNLKKFVEDRLSAGSDLNKIASLAKSHFFDEINQIQNESGMAFRDFLESLYGQKRQTSRSMGLQQQGQQDQGAGKQQLASSMMAAVEMMRQLKGK